MNKPKIIPVYVQRPNQPQTKTLIGEAPDNLSPEAVANRVRVPDGCFIDGKVMHRTDRKRIHWSLVANVNFRESK
jgi:hypothetical protein